MLASLHATPAASVAGGGHTALSRAISTLAQRPSQFPRRQLFLDEDHDSELARAHTEPAHEVDPFW
jgi:hypothetical protein